MASVANQSRRDVGVTALYLGIFGAGWLSWAKTEPPLRTWLAIVAWLGIGIAISGAVIGFRSTGSNAALRDHAAGRRYGIIVALEFAAAGLGAAVLIVAGQAEFVPVWVCLIVGAHFFPLAPLLRDKMLVPLGVAMCAVAMAGFITALASTVDASTVVGTGAGLLLVGYAGMALAKAIRLPRG